MVSFSSNIFIWHLILLILFHFDGVQENKDLLKCQIIPELFDTGKYIANIYYRRKFNALECTTWLIYKMYIDIHISNGKYLTRHTTKFLLA